MQYSDDKVKQSNTLKSQNALVFATLENVTNTISKMFLMYNVKRLGKYMDSCCQENNLLLTRCPLPICKLGTSPYTFFKTIHAMQTTLENTTHTNQVLDR